MRRAFAATLRCPCCGVGLSLEERLASDGRVVEGVLRSACGRAFPVVGGVPRMLPDDLAITLPAQHPAFFTRHPDLRPPPASRARRETLRTLQAFGDEWRRFPELLEVHSRIFRWYFEGVPVHWPGCLVLDAGCGMGRWLRFATREGASVVGMDVSPAIDVAAAREDADLVQADLRWPPFAAGAFDLVYSLGVLHHLEDPIEGLRALARLVRPGGELRFYVYRSLADDPLWRRATLAAVTRLRRLTTRLPYSGLHAVAWSVAAVATLLFLWPRRALRRVALAERLTRGLPLAQYTDVPFRMLVAEQFDRFGAPIEGRYTRADVEGWVAQVGLRLEAVLPELGWRVVARRDP